MAQNVLPLLRMTLYLADYGTQVDPYSSYVDVFYVALEIGYDVLEEEKLLIVFMYLIRFLRVLLAGEMFVESPQMLVFLPPVVKGMINYPESYRCRNLCWS